MKVVKVREEFINLSKHKVIKIDVDKECKNIYLLLDREDSFVVFSSEYDVYELAQDIQTQLKMFFKSNWSFLDFGVTINKHFEKKTSEEPQLNR